MKAVLGLEDGQYVVGEGFGVEGECAGELVFNTQMTGYMESLTDPSYFGQILMFTFPLIGNYGVDLQNFQNRKVCALGCITKEICEKPAAQPSIRSYFEENNLLGLSGIDTRALTIKLRVHGTMRAALIVGSDDGEAAVRLARKTPAITDIIPIPEVSCKEPYHIPGSGKRIAVIDLGIKKNMITSLQKRGGDLHIFPYNTTADKILACKPDALFVSNGPGDPKQATDAIRCIRELLGQLPIFGICMGNQVSALALGGNTYKLRFGHRGANQPVRYKDGRIFITTQNHGFAVDAGSLPEGSKVTYTNVNDGTVEGFENEDLSLTTVQFHPEAHGGPRDTEAHFFDALFRRIA
ncbi:glutamine-hydrolyzing carbamoyl-phosphate synthase small subunit [uncultured Methanoregula sp.]|uniref:glutamine-hydrolyzing carbamoyl-phosphate synthase small subunit n=1 Tax=uncultured Methanoregula sp. TaxID=1005933 RepID=UPI002AAB3584|nr:glutamine-hydrolyzing carbamoyl-phosphate synthase small subunit [uncultured Methanoregula sp.]